MGTPSFTLRLFSTLCNQLGDEVTVLWDMARYDRLRRLDRLFRGAQAQFAFADWLDKQFVARLQTSRRTAFRWDYDPSLLVDARPPEHDTYPKS
jgi:hypothetical protein